MKAIYQDYQWKIVDHNDEAIVHSYVWNGHFYDVSNVVQVAEQLFVVFGTRPGQQYPHMNMLLIRDLNKVAVDEAIKNHNYTITFQPISHAKKESPEWNLFSSIVRNHARKSYLDMEDAKIPD